MERRDLGRQLFGRLDDLRGKVLPRTEVRARYAVLAYRRFFPPSPESRKAFAMQLDHLRKNFAVRPLPEVIQDLRTGRGTADNTICITVDGGHGDFYHLAYPALRARGLPATVFLPTGFIDGGTWLWFDRIIYAIRNTRAATLEIHPPGELTETLALETPAQKRSATGHLLQLLQRMPPYERDPLMNDLLERLGMLYPPYPPREFEALTWDQISEMWPNNISFGAHTVTHPNLTVFSSEGEIHAEMAGAKQRIEQKLGVECMLLCYPGGTFDSRVVDVAKNCGFQGAVTNLPGPNPVGGDPFRIHRMSVEPAFDLERFAQTCAVLQG